MHREHGHALVGRRAEIRDPGPDSNWRFSLPAIPSLMKTLIKAVSAFSDLLWAHEVIKYWEWNAYGPVIPLERTWILSYQ